MTPLEQLHAAQHDDVTLTSDHALTAFLAGISPTHALNDLTPTTETERRHLEQARRSTT